VAAHSGSFFVGKWVPVRDKGEAREKAAKRVGVGASYVSDAKKFPLITTFNHHTIQKD
jgi:hypothetical protein